MVRIVLATALACALIPPPARAQFAIRKDQPDRPVEPEARARVIEAALKALDEAYVFPETARKMAEAVRGRVENKEYDGITGSKELARALTEHLQAVSNDKHLRVIYSGDPLPDAPDRPEPDRAQLERMRARSAERNHGFEKVERLDGNVGYIDLRGFHPATIGGETAAAAMNFVANADALIIDVRRNGGGDPAMVALICSYLFGPDPVHLNDLYFRPDDSTHQWWTLPYVPGRRFEGKPVYVLTSRRTFSAAEEFTYNLKNLKRATIVGETTGGGAHPGGVRKLDAHFAMFVPSGRAINPVSKTNWEGTGVSPDVDVPADHALPTAHLAALTAAIDSLESAANPDEATAGSPRPDPDRLDALKAAAETVRKALDELKAKGEPERTAASEK